MSERSVGFKLWLMPYLKKVDNCELADAVGEKLLDKLTLEVVLELCFKLILAEVTKELLSFIKLFW